MCSPARTAPASHFPLALPDAMAVPRPQDRHGTGRARSFPRWRKRRPREADEADKASDHGKVADEE